jgi:hypothetical protein
MCSLAIRRADSTNMKTSILVAAILTSAVTAPIVSAQDKSEPTKPAMSMDMDKPMSQMQENMKKMHEQMEKIRATTDPTERQKLMQEHMQTMQENMKAMRGMGGPMMGSDHHGGMTMGEHKDKAGGDMMKSQEMMKHHELMEKRMDMMQMMMQQMMQHIQTTESTPGK